MAAPERIALGHEAAIYYGTDWDGVAANAFTTATWTEIKTVDEVTIAREFDKLNITSRRSNGVKTEECGLLNLMVEFNLNIHRAEAVAIALEAAFYAKTIQYYMVLDNDKSTTGARGIVFPALLFNWPQSQPIADKISAPGLQLANADGEFQFKAVVQTA